MNVWPDWRNVWPSWSFLAPTERLRKVWPGGTGQYWVGHGSAWRGEARQDTVNRLRHPTFRRGMATSGVFSERRGSTCLDTTSVPGSTCSRPLSPPSFPRRPPRHARETTLPGLCGTPKTLRLAGMTWEDALSLAGNRVPKKDLWEALIPTMGYMALLRNLRNFSEAGIDMVAAALVSES